MLNVSTMDDQPDLEHYLERWALEQCLPSTFVQCLRRNQIAPSIECATVKGKTITIQGSDIADKGTWRKFLKSFSYEGQTYSLSQDGEPLAKLYQEWIVREHTTRYRAITSQSHHDWLRRVIMLTIARFLLWHKYERYRAGEQCAIVDPWVANQLHQLWLLREATKDTARLIHHMIENPDRGQHLIEQFVTALDEQIRTHSLLFPNALPLLSQGTSHPFLLLLEAPEDHDA